MIEGIFIGLGLAGVMWLTWYMAPLGDPETGAGRQERTPDGPGYQPHPKSPSTSPPGAE